ncbi:cysteine desulfurase family protein [Candidatus Vidania fulgoroideorum]
MKVIYLDSSSSSRVDKEVIKAICLNLKKYGNSFSKHIYGLNSSNEIENCRTTISKIIHCKMNEIIFTSGATESNNLAIKGYAFNNSSKKRFLALKTEHKSVINSMLEVKKFNHFVYFMNPKRDGLLDFSKFKKKVKKYEINFVSVMWVNNELGVIQNINKLSNFCKKNKIILHVDATQSFGKIKINLKKIKIDLLSISVHKNHGPKGVGILYIKKGINIIPQINGGIQERNLRSGTLANHQIVGMSKTFEISSRDFMINLKKIRVLSKYLISSLKKIKLVKINGNRKHSIDNIINVSFFAINSESLIKLMKNFAISSKTTCDDKKFSFVLESIYSREVESIRITISKYNSLHEIKLFSKILRRNVRKLRKFSKLWRWYKNKSLTILK